MSETDSGARLSIARMILIPALITLAVTVLRLVGELQHWPKLLFNPEAGGGAAVLGIAWLPFIFGPYFAMKLVRNGQGPASGGKAIGLAVASLLALAGGVACGIFSGGKGPLLILTIVFFVLAAVLVFPGWGALAKTLLVYAYSARIPVAVVMFFAIQGRWGTHYDALPPNYSGRIDFWPLYFQIGILPQLVFWIVYTMITGSLLGSIFGAVAGRKKAVPQTA